MMQPLHAHYFMNFQDSLDQMKSALRHYDTVNQKISTKTIGWHIHHLCLTNSIVIKSMHKSDPANFELVDNPVRENVMGRKTIMRGRVQAPDPLNPSDDSELSVIEDAFAAMNELLGTWEHLDANSYFTHPHMGKLNKELALNFMTIHNVHHLKIIEDILAA